MTKDYQPVWAIVDADTASTPDHTVFFNSGRRVLQKLVYGLVPSFIQRKVRPNTLTRLHPTSYLDGLRGVASFIVFLGHYTEETLGWYSEPYGLYEDGARSSPLQLPFIRVIYSPRPMVHIFFIISGYVLSYKPLKQIHHQQLSALLTTLSSSVFRRALRLFLPSIVTLFVMALAVHFDISDDRFAPSFYSLSDQLVHWWEASWKLMRASWAINTLAYPQPVYNPALWTIPVEFAQSLILFVTIVGLSRCVTKVRLVLLSVIIAFCLLGGQIYTVEFLGGMLIAEINLLRDPSLFTPASSPTTLPNYDLSDAIEKHKPCLLRTQLIRAFWIANVVSGLYIASWTNSHQSEIWGIRFLARHTPSPYDGQHFWFCIGAFQIVAAFTQLHFLQAIFNTAIPQYLGNISYALYLMHNLCLTALEPRMNPYLDYHFGKRTFWGRHACWIGGLVVAGPIVVCVADVFWRAVDMPTVRFARWLEGRCVVSSRKS
jgi:peptidoglycan/LPS O-acetylase OafA/YrhL